MTTIDLSWRHADGRPTTGVVALTPYRRTVDGETIVTAQTITTRVTGSGQIEVDPSGPGTAYRASWKPSNGHVWHDWVSVPDVAQIAYTALPQVDPQTLTPARDADPAWWAALDALRVQLDGTAVVTVPGPAGPVGERGPVGPQGVPGIQGERGPAGPVGADGPRGERGEVGPVGPAGLEWRGMWDAGIDYAEDDAVAYGGSSWFAVGDPARGEVPSVESTAWQAMALQGAQGPRGEAGPQGPRGETGPQGPQGLQGLQGTQGVQGERGLTGEVGPVGAQGLVGPANVLRVGAVVSGAQASATITGTAPSQSLSLVLPQGERGLTGPQGAPGALTNSSSYVIVGPGRPDAPTTTGGVITGSEPVGARYESTDEAGVGARTWRKVVGNKWVVTDGDTGWRNVSSLFTTLTDGAIYLIRVGRLVTWRLDNATIAAGDPSFGIPAGFGQSGQSGYWNGYFTAYNRDRMNAPTAWARIAQTNRLFPQPQDFQFGQHLYTTSDPWPTTLPGTPA